jgi:hypothetical protein
MDNQRKKYVVMEDALKEMQDDLLEMRKNTSPPANAPKKQEAQSRHGRR